LLLAALKQTLAVRQILPVLQQQPEAQVIVHLLEQVQVQVQPALVLEPEPLEQVQEQPELALEPEPLVLEQVLQVQEQLELVQPVHQDLNKKYCCTKTKSCLKGAAFCF
jgi:hypothetical protein